MPRTTNSIVIERPVPVVFEFVENPANDSIWRTGIVESGHTETSPSGVGTTGRESFHTLGREFETTWEITEYEPNHKVAYRSTAGPVEYEGVWLYEAVDVGTRLSIVIDWTLTDRELFGRMTDRFMEMFDKRQMEAELRTLKKLLEA